MSTTITAIEQPEHGSVEPARPPLALRPVLFVAAALGLALLLTSGRYGYFGDELYFLGAAKHLDWGFADQPPLIPALAWLMDRIFPGQVAGLRLPATLITAAGAVLVAMLAREFGGRRRAQVLSAVTYAVSLGTLWSGHLLYTSTFDTVLWTLVVFLIVRWMRTRSDVLLLWAGVATGVALQTKYLIPVLWLGIGIAVLAVGPRRLLTRPLLWVGALTALAMSAPALIWQARHGWPQLTMGGVISSSNETSGPIAGRLMMVVYIPVWAGLLVGAVLLGYGFWQLLRGESWRRYRFLAVACLIVFAVFFAAAGRPYYLAGLFAPLWAVAAVQLERRKPAKWWRWVPTVPVYVISALFTAVTTLPILPVSTVPPADSLLTSSGSIGWPQLAQTVSDAYDRLPAGQQAKAVVIGETYWSAGALDHYAAQYRLPAVYSANRGYWYFGAPPDDKTVALYVTPFPGRLGQYFDQVDMVAKVDNPQGLPVLNQNLSVCVCGGPKQPWSKLWPELKTM